MNEKYKYDDILQALIDSIKRRDGAEKLERLRVELLGVAEEGMKREMIVQILAREEPKFRRRFLALYPELIRAYRNRLK